MNAPDVINVIMMLVQSIASLSKSKLTELLYKVYLWVRYLKFIKEIAYIFSYNRLKSKCNVHMVITLIPFTING